MESRYIHVYMHKNQPTQSIKQNAISLPYISIQIFSLKQFSITSNRMAMKYKGPAIGIDLGTTYSCVAVWQDQNNRAEIIHNDQGNRTTPSFVAFTDDQRLIGDSAKNQAASNPVNTIFGNLSFFFLLPAY